MSDSFTPSRPVFVPIAGSSQQFPVRRIYCVGRNYAAHAREMGKDPAREPPFFFTKWADTVALGPAVEFPSATRDCHHEVELVVAIGKDGRDVSLSEARGSIYGFAVGIDLTRRDLQDEAKRLQRPWDTAKNFDQSAPLGAIHPASRIGHLERGEITLHVNGSLRQGGDIADMIWKSEEIIVHLSRLWKLAEGDLIFTGTPAGVGPVAPGDKLLAHVQGLQPLSIEITAKQ